VTWPTMPLAGLCVSCVNGVPFNACTATNADVSLVNWIKTPAFPPTAFLLDGEPVDGITPELRTPGHSTGVVAKLGANKGRCFQGPTPSVPGFIIDADEAQALLKQTDVAYRQVVRPYMIGDDITVSPTQEPGRWIIDFAQMNLEEAERYPAAMKIVRERVKPIRERTQKAEYRQKWWQFTRPRPEMRVALRGLARCVVSVAQGKRLLLAWTDAWTCPSNLTFVFAFDDDYSMGIVSSSAHGAWARSRSSTLEDRLRYTPSSVFETFPWPFPTTTDAQRECVADAIRKVIGRRQELCAAGNFGLTTLYNAVDEGAYTALKALHGELDEAVAAAYGWPKAAAHDNDEIVQRLLKLNREIAGGKRKYDPFGTQAAAAAEMLLPD